MQLAASLEQAARGEAPRHALAMLAAGLDAVVHEPDAAPSPRRLDRARARVLPPIDLWTLARRVRAATRPGDVVFCSSEAGGLQFAAVCAAANRPRLALFVHNLDRPRGRFALRWWRAAAKVDLFLACSQRQVEFLRGFLGLPAERVRHVWDHTDTAFFSAGPAAPAKARPLVISVGLEQRDYKTLAIATADLDVDVRISGFSKDAGAMARTFPETLPANLARRFYAWPELAQLYRDADVVVVSCHENRYAAGVQSLMEAMASGRPVVATATAGLAAYLGPMVVAVPPGDAAAMRAAILRTLADPAEAARRAAEGHALAQVRFGIERYVGEIDAAMRALG